MMKPLNTNPVAWRYKALIGTGGIGSGTFFALKGNHTLGREESRPGRFLDRRDYCKQHIIEHYIQTLLGKPFRTVAVGKVGDDEAGRRLIDEMREAGLSLEHVEEVPGEQTLYSICLVYPDGAGGNLTVSDSASETVDAGFVRRSEGEFARYAGVGLTLAAPEVPLEARAELLRLGRQYRFFNTASLTSTELRAASTGASPTDGKHARDMLKSVDLLAINIDEAATLAGVPADGPREAIVRAAIEALRLLQPDIQCSITAGKDGSWTWDRQSLVFVPAFRVEVASTAGAGDSFLGGLVVGITAGLTLGESQHLATLIAGLKVTSVHTIHKGVDRESLRTFAQGVQAALPDRVRELLEEQA
jgi:ribokinase